MADQRKQIEDFFARVLALRGSGVDFLAHSGRISGEMSTYGYYRFAAMVPPVRVADVPANVAALVTAMDVAVQEGAQVVLFPELCLTGCSCGDLFFQRPLQQAALRGLERFAAETAAHDVPAVLTLPVAVGDALFNHAAVVRGGKLLGLVPKSVLPNTRDAYERRWFRPASELRATTLSLGAWENVPVGTDLVFTDGTDLSFGIEIGEDLWSVLPPSSLLALRGARVILNPSASVALAGKAEYRRQLVAQQSARCLSAYIYASAGVGESTQDSVCSGHALVAESGRIVAENERFAREGNAIYADIDLARIAAARLSEGSFNESPALPAEWAACRRVNIGSLAPTCDLSHARIAARPFLPPAGEEAARCEDILNIQAHGLARRVECSGARSLVIGISGGLDSTLALLVCQRACRLLGWPMERVLALTMPGFGTTGRTYNNAVEMIKLIGASFREVNIKAACLQHFADIGHDPAQRTNTYENVQARERTQILMDLANKMGGLVVGTGDLSEIALGWCTYNGDQMSMYGVNCSVPKSLIRCLISHIARESSPELAAILHDINATPVSPELLPPADDGSIDQRTEDLLGPYDLHDFFLYHFVKYGAEPAKLRALACRAFAGEFDEELIERTLATFIHRFFTQQFKRSCAPDGPKVGSIALSPRGDWRMPSDASAAIWKD